MRKNDIIFSYGLAFKNIKEFDDIMIISKVVLLF